MEDHGAHVVAPGHRGFEAGKLKPILSEMVANDQVRGMFFIIDTAKKIANLMDKTKASEFGSWARTIVQRGGTVLALAHTNKRAGADGKQIFAGTADLVDDLDCALILAERPERTASDHRIVEFTNIKRRGNVSERALYSYDDRGDTSYRGKLDSVVPLGLDSFAPLAEAAGALDVAVANSIKKLIAEGVVQKMQIVDAVRDALPKTSKRKVIAVLEGFCGDAWDFEVQAHGAKVFHLINRPAFASG